MRVRLLLGAFVLLARSPACTGSLKKSLRARDANAAGVTSRDQSQDESGDQAEDDPACDCECCVSQRRDDLISNGLDGVQCAPRSELGGSLGDGGCTQQCTTENPAAYQATDSSVDYARFCLRECRPSSTQLNELCSVGSAQDTQAENTPDLKNIKAAQSLMAAAKASVRAPTDAGMTQTSSRVAQGAKQVPELGVPIGASLALAKGDMLEAMMHAKAAGQAAMIAKESYEMSLRSTRQAAEDAGKAILKEIKREGGEQAKEVLEIHNQYVAAAKSNAIAAALGIAQVYYNSMETAMKTALGWSIRSGQIAGAAASRKALAGKLAAQANKYMSLSEYDLAREENLQAHQAMDQAQGFAKMADSAYKQADAIQRSQKWYIYAEEAAAANMLAASMPPDVAPPGMPILPGVRPGAIR